MSKESTNTKERHKTKLKEPGKYTVVFHNDDFTPMDFVVLVLVRIFFKSLDEAHQLMMKVHLEGKADIGTYSYDIAMTKANNATHVARVNGFPLRITVKSV